MTLQFHSTYIMIWSIKRNLRLLNVDEVFIVIVDYPWKKIVQKLFGRNEI
jgi:hypothetical protein